MLILEDYLMQDYFESIIDIGENMLVCGAEVHRVEESIERMCAAVGYYRTDVFIITSSMVVTVYSEEANYTQTRRIKDMRMDLERLHKFNALSREICSRKMTPEEIFTKIKEIKSTKRTPFWLEGLSYTVIAGAFTVFFGGGWIEALVSALIGFVLCNIVYLSDRASLNKVFAKFVGAFFVTLGAWGAMKFGIIGSMDKVIIGNIMLLVPGVGLTNSLRDLLVGDSIAGWLRFSEAMLLTLAMAAGYIVCVFLVGGVAA